jgi:hypothetical protein
MDRSLTVNFNKHKSIYTLKVIKSHKYWYGNWHWLKGNKVLNRNKNANGILLKYYIPQGIK